jgi:uncharacterized protein
MRLGAAYANGKGIGQDDVEAVKWYRAAAEQGNPLAQAAPGFMYERGRGTGKDEAEAVKWYRMAAEQGNALATETTWKRQGGIAWQANRAMP